MSDLLDRELALKVSVYKDQEAFQVLYQRYDQEIYNFLFHRLPRKEDAEDMAAQVLLKGWEYLTKEAGDKVRNFRAFIYKVARNEVAGFYRAQGRIPPLLELDKPNEFGDYPEVPDGREDAFLKQVKIQDESYLIDCVQKLPEPYREIIALRFFEGLEIKEIAEIIGKTLGNTRVLIHRGVKTLRDIMLVS